MIKNLRKHLKICIFLLLLLVPVSASVGAPRIFVNNYFVDSDAAPVIENGRTLVPVRIISEKLGYNVNWDAATKTVEITGDAKTIKLTIGSSTYLDDGTEMPLDVGAKIVNSRTMVPIRLVSEAFSQKVIWDNENRVVAVGEGYQDQASSTCTFEAVKVTRVIDGDTIEIDRGKGIEKVRFILVDSPETKHPKKQVEYYGKEASEFTTKWLEGRRIYLEKDVRETDKYGRLLRYIWLVKPATDTPTNEEIGSYMFNSYLVRDGYAVVAQFPPDIKYVEVLKTFEAYAIQNNLGLYGVPNTVEAETKTKTKTAKTQFKNLIEKDGQYLASIYAPKKGEVDKYNLSSVYEVSSKGDFLIVKGSFNYNKEITYFMSSDDEILKNDEYTFKLDKSTKYMSVGGTAEPEYMGLKRFLRYFKEAENSGLGLDIYIENGVVKSVSISS